MPMNTEIYQVESLSNRHPIKKQRITKAKDIKMEDLLVRFCVLLKEHVNCDGIEYRNDAEGYYFIDGVMQKNCCQYQLKIQDKESSEIIISRKLPFEDREFEIIEEMISGLMQVFNQAINYDKLQSESDVFSSSNACEK